MKDDTISRQAEIEVVKHAWAKGLEPTQYLEELPAVQTCEDVVSRQAAHKWETCFECPLSHGCPKTKNCTNEQAIEYASQIPNDCPLSAQSERKTDGDTISRQAAIDHWRLIIDATSMDSRYNMGFVDGLEFCINHLSTMPSVQSEIIRCKDCKHWRDSDGVYRRGVNAESKCPLNTKEVYAGTFYCGYAERRTDG